MYFSNVKIHNYKSYHDSATLELERGINVVVGKNNAGKTALLEALSLKFGAVPHRSLRTLPSDSIVLEQTSTVEFTFIRNKEELLDLLIDAQSKGDNDFTLPLPTRTDSTWKKLKLGEYDDSAVKRFGEWFMSHETYTFRIQREAFSENGANWHVTDESYVSPNLDRAGKYEPDGLEHYGKFRIDPFKRSLSFHGHNQVSGGGRRHFDDFILRLGSFLHRYVYIFRAERVPFRTSKLGMERTLTSDAGNLPEVLHLLNLDQFNTYNRLVREVLPEIKQVGVHKLSNNEGEVRIWTDEAAVSRDALAFSLAECGAGVGQVLSILYVILTSTRPQTILIDEPQGFLHPGAVRKLVEILRQSAETKHQIIIATHSPTVITSADPTTITLIKQERDESVFERININETKHQQKYLGEVGARLTDVFGYDRVLWVEGETEELCFPIILRELTQRTLIGTAILRVQNTGDFNRRDTKSVISIYERLSHHEGGLVPPLVGFIFDRETRDLREQEDLKRQSHNHIHFTPKRLYENYLLNPAAIAAVANNIRGFSRRKIRTQQVQEWLDKNCRDKKYYKPLTPPNDREDWTNNVHGACLLDALFLALSHKRVTFDKTEHSIALTEWVIKNSPQDLVEISNLLSDVLGDT